MRGIRLELAALICMVSASAGSTNGVSSIHQTGADGAPPTRIAKQRITFQSHDLTLVGVLFTPDGSGPFPAILWNHGSERNPGNGAQFDEVAKYFVPAGYVVFAPIRRGHGYSQGDYISETLERTRRMRGRDAANREMVRLMETEQLDDQLAGLSFLVSLRSVDSSRIVVAGCSYGGIETLLAAEGKSPFRAAIAISPAALSWHENPLLQQRLVQAVNRIEIPVLLLQPARDASLEPSRVLGAEFARLRKDFAGKVYPPTGPTDEQRHCFGGPPGTHVWAPDALAFITRVLR